MKKKLVCIGNSHMAAAKRVLEKVAFAHDLEPVYIVSNWIDNDNLINALVGLKKFKPVEVLFNGSQNHRTLVIDPAEIHSFVSVGIFFGGPGDLFRVIAPKSFTGSFDGIPPPEIVQCPWCMGANSKQIGLYEGLLSSACLIEIFESSLARSDKNPLIEIVDGFSRLAHIPTPPMPSNTVIHRFGRHVYDSGLGRLMIDVWNSWAEKKSNQSLRLFDIQSNISNDGWLIPSAAASGHPDYEIHGNYNYGDGFFDKLYEWLGSN